VFAGLRLQTYHSFTPLAALWCTRTRKCGNEPPCELFGGGVFLEGEIEVNSAGPRPISPPPPSPSPPPIRRRRSLTPPPPTFMARRRNLTPPPPTLTARRQIIVPPSPQPLARGRNISPPPLYRHRSTPLMVRRPVTPPSPPSPPPELQRNLEQVRPSKLQRRSGTKDGGCVTQ